IVDYTRAPRTTGSAAIDTIFVCSTIIDEGGGTNYAYYWSNTTHANMQNGRNAAYVSFGEALGWMEMPPFSGNYYLLDVHGAGAQRSDPKSGDPAAWPYGHGPQGDVIRIYNYVRLVRDAGTTNIDDSQSGASKVPQQFRLEQNYPNPFNPSTIISFSIPNEGNVLLKIFNVLGQEVAILVNENLEAGDHQFEWQAGDLTGSIYYYTLTNGSYSKTKKMILLK
ncbi:MAG: T9SS type A sorting domain-containing protein, partial [Gammaproteobacteria bacterium]|nr:T9SS type A sorting domain-containing protein [Gammaproteobacteria bacterium]